MKKRMISLFIALIMLFIAGCSGSAAAEGKAAETENTETYTSGVEVEAASAAKGAAKVASPKLTLDVTQEIHFPAVTAIGDAALVESGMLNDTTGYLAYSDADEETLDRFFAMCAYCGLFRYSGTQEDGTIQYGLMRPGSAYWGLVTLYPEEKLMIVQTDLDIVEVQDEQMQELVDYYMQDLVMPSGYGPNVHPEFFASVGRTGADAGMLAKNYFGGEQEQCWQEVYAKVDYPTLHKYLSDMLLCGFDIRYESVTFNEEDALDAMMFRLDNGSSQLLIIYFASSEMANLFYQPGIDRYLLKGAEYDKYMPRD